MFVNGTNKQMSGCTEVATAVDLAVAESSGERVTPRDPTANLLLPSSDIQMPSPVQVEDSTQGRAVTSLSSEYEHLLSMEPLNYEKTATLAFFIYRLDDGTAQSNRFKLHF